MQRKLSVAALGVALTSVVLLGCNQPAVRSSSSSAPPKSTGSITSSQALSASPVQTCERALRKSLQGQTAVTVINFANDSRSYRVAEKSVIRVTQSPNSPIKKRLSVRPSGSLCMLGYVTGSVGSESVLLYVHRVGPIELFNRTPPIEPAPTDLVLHFVASVSNRG